MKSQWEEKWLEDIEFLKENLIEKHNNLFFNISRKEFESRIDKLKSMIGDLDYEEMKVEISRVVASIGDAHTSVAFPANKYLPIKFYWFEDGIYIIRTSEAYKNLLFKKVIAIEDIKIDKILHELSEIISFENEYFLKAQSMKYMQASEVLYGLLISDSMDNIRITTEHHTVKVRTVNISELEYSDSQLPLYARRSNENLWYEYLEDKEELYIKYNYCREDGNKTISKKIAETIDYIEKNSIAKITIDLRNNLGGDSRLLEPLLYYIKNNPKINDKENLKVIIGRETFSSGLLNAYQFKFETNCVIWGEPSGGKPNCYGEILRFVLPNSKFSVSYSTRYYKIIDDDSIMSLYPDKTLYEKIEDYRNWGEI
ncbi:peptidase S41 [Clostridium sp.]|uniref:peptidase S41 n=1 Tax=Clostridium sp. TaxID=1506 RepID=UPI00321684A4